MIEGLRILNQSVVMETVGWYTSSIVICGIIAAICFIIAFDPGIMNDFTQVICFCVGIVAISVLLIIGVWEPKVETDRYRYEAIIDESVSLVDIYDKYEVIEQRGDIWVLEDKE